MTHRTMAPIRAPINVSLPSHVVAFEVSKHELVVDALPGDRQLAIANTRAAVTRVLRAELKRNRRDGLGPMLVVCEATGGYEAPVLDAAVGLDIDAHKAHGTRVRCFAKYKGLKAKNDPLDARVLARYGAETAGLRRYAPPAPEIKALRALKERRDDLVAMLGAETNRLEHAGDARVKKSLNASIATLSESLRAIEAEIASLIGLDEALARKNQLIRTVPGVGPVVASAVLAHLPELGSLSRGQAAALAGLAPFDNDSGAKRGRRSIEAGRSAVRRPLYMAALVAIRVSPHLRSFAHRIIARGNPFKLAVTAVMRKLIVILNAVLTSGQPCRYAKQH